MRQSLVMTQRMAIADALMARSEPSWGFGF
jgi:hypothetical protein